MKIQHTAEDPFAGLINMFVARDFPGTVRKNDCETLDLLTDEVVGTKQTRLGPKPNPESLVAIRTVIRDSIVNNAPVPFMVPWGSEKPDGSSIDVAELSAVKTLMCLAARVRTHYKPGVVFRIRLEDVSAPHLFFEDPDTARQNAARYTSDFVMLLNVLGVSDFIQPAAESMLTDEATFNAKADELLPALEGYLLVPSNESESVLAAAGWQGGIHPDTIRHYLSQYEKANPTRSYRDNIHVLSRYFAAALARRHLKIRGDDPAWKGQFIDLSFASQPPGTESYFGRRVTYRTIPSGITSNHIPPWRAKGYLVMGDESAAPKLISFNEVKSKDLNPYSIILEGENGGAVEVQTDYVLEA